MNTREILTLQFGHYSNFVGSHWWNVQELGFEYNTNTDNPSEINHDVFYREGQTNKREVTYTPRLLLTDLKGSLKSLPQQGYLYDPPVDPNKFETCWHSEVAIEEEEKIAKNEYQKEIDNPAEPKIEYNLEDSVDVWSDFLYARFHPRTVNVINEYQHESEETPFNIFPVGQKLWETDYFKEDYADKIRSNVEECDNFQGFQILLDANDAFGGLAMSCMEYICDEYENKSIFALPLIPSYYKDYSYTTEEESRKSGVNDQMRLINLGLCYNMLIENSSVFVPLSTSGVGWKTSSQPRSFNHVNYKPESWYHSSAILASALDTFTLKYRLKNTCYSLSDFAVDLTPYGRKATAASICLPFSLNTGGYLIDCLDNWEGPLTQSITPNCTIGSSRLMQLYTLRGVGANQLKKPSSVAGKQLDMPAYRCNTIDEMLSMYLAYTCHASASNVTSVSKGLQVKKPFPDIFDKRVGRNGNIIADDRNPDMSVQSVPIMTGLHSGSEIGNMIESLHTAMNNIKIARFQQYASAGLEKDEYNECLAKLFDFRELYDDNYVL
ncbi:PREDICTED: protein misato [Nicrophorus vespilloides]|uniref:Protein misato n=1 Tax=Nicrophorus vespilloides TaxID=110193 RepID=A0ABM1N3L2_NICVS|nr:PREDICTED: protein misato [Nicrophorus vespilloides]